MFIKCVSLSLYLYIVFVFSFCRLCLLIILIKSPKGNLCLGELKKGDRRLVQSKSNIACGFLSFLRQWAATRSLSCNRADSCTGAFSFSSLGVLQSSLCSLPLCFKSMPLEIHFISLFKPRRCHIERIIFLLSCFH